MRKINKRGRGWPIFKKNVGMMTSIPPFLTMEIIYSMSACKIFVIAKSFAMKKQKEAEIWFFKRVSWLQTLRKTH